MDVAGTGEWAYNIIYADSNWAAFHHLFLHMMSMAQIVLLDLVL